MSQNRSNSPQQGQQGLQRQPQGGAVSRMVSGTLTRLSDNEETRQLSTYNADEGALWLEEAATKGHVVAPSMSIQMFPHGRGLAVSIVRVTDFNSQGTELYPIQGSSNLGLHKNVLDNIGRGYAIDWPREWSVDLPFTKPGALQPDPRDEDPWVVQWQVCGRVRKLDGGWTTLPAMVKEVDLREGSAEIEQIRVRQADKAVSDLPPNATQAAIDQRLAFGKKKADAEIAQIRKFIKSHAQTKARLMVIGTLVRRSYSKEELQKPFYVFSSIWVGRSDNPEIDKMFAQGAMEMEMSARGVLYGGAEPAQLPAVSDQPYQEDAEMVAYNRAMAEGEAGAATETGPTEVSTKQCAPGKCLGMEPGAVHVPQCFGAPAPEPEPWVIPQGRGPAAGLKVNDPQISAPLFESMRTFYQLQIEDAETPDLTRQGLLEEQKFLEAEIKRRGLFEHAPKS